MSSMHVHVHAGRMHPNFPFSTGGRILAPVTPLRLLEGSNSLQLIVPSFDGFLYAIDATTGCAGARLHQMHLYTQMSRPSASPPPAYWPSNHTDNHACRKSISMHHFRMHESNISDALT
jgi:hypothetical protein